jgi:hypothetical protein
MTRALAQVVIGIALIAAATAAWFTARQLHARAAHEERLMTFQESLPATSLLETANADFRKAQKQAHVLGVEGLDRLLQAYASALRNEPFNRDAAYSYEYVARLRDQVARTRRPPASNTTSTPVTPDDLPDGPTLHGRPGAHPSDSPGEEFEIVTPMDYGEREAQPEATPGRRLPRKG